MLTPQEVIPFLTHDRPFVREHALRYFDESGAPGPLNPKDREMRDLLAAALATAIMTGAELPEAAEWERRVERDEAHARALRRELNDGFVEETRGGGGGGGGGQAPRRLDEFFPGEGGQGRGIARPRRRRALPPRRPQSRPQRPVPVRQREKVQEVLRG